jgi:hypothetical protein
MAMFVAVMLVTEKGSGYIKVSQKLDRWIDRTVGVATRMRSNLFTDACCRDGSYG